MNALARLRLLVARGVVNLINDAGGLQLLQIDALDDETLDGVERVQNFGQTSHPPRGSVPVLVAVGGSRDHMVAVAVDNAAHRPTGLQEGESAIYNAHGVRFLFDKDGNAVLVCKNFIVQATETDISGALRNNGSNIGSNHTHSNVQPGSGTSGGPQ